MLNLNEVARPAETLFDDVKQYVEAEKDKAKLQTTKVASTGIARMLSMMVILLVFFAALLVLSFAVILTIGELTGSYALAALGVAAVLIIILVVLWARRKTMFVDSFVRMFIKMFYGDEE